MSRKFVLVIHGGAGCISPTLEGHEVHYRQGLVDALEAGAEVLRAGGSSLDAVTAAVVSLEDCPWFNAGRGSVLTQAGTYEMDAAIMDGRTRAAGAVAGITTVRNPVLAARLIMEQSPHVMLIGPGAENYAAAHGLEMADPTYFFTQMSYDQLLAAQRGGQATLEHEHDTEGQGVDNKYGTVGAVACDRYGDLAAATSTGGITNKLAGRVGDSPVIGAGTYADNRSVAVSATGTGEMFIRSVAAHAIAARVLYQDQSLEQACLEVLEQEVAQLGGSGGLIAVDRFGNVAMPFITDIMYRGTVGEDGRAQVWIYR
jgi:beta-aspartyl-peptidase (threonine type)